MLYFAQEITGHIITLLEKNQENPSIDRKLKVLDGRGTSAVGNRDGQIVYSHAAMLFSETFYLFSLRFLDYVGR